VIVDVVRTMYRFCEHSARLMSSLLSPILLLALLLSPTLITRLEACDPDHDWVNVQTIRNAILPGETLDDVFFRITQSFKNLGATDSGEALLVSFEISDGVLPLIEGSKIGKSDAEKMLLEEAASRKVRILGTEAAVRISRELNIDPGSLSVPAVAGKGLVAKGIGLVLQVSLTEGSSESSISVDRMKGNESLFLIDTTNEVKVRYKISRPSDGAVLWIDEIEGNSKSNAIYKMFDRKRQLSLKVAEARFTIHRPWMSEWARPDDRALLVNMTQSAGTSEVEPKNPK
jgi:hypothetical protein